MSRNVQRQNYTPDKYSPTNGPSFLEPTLLQIVNDGVNNIIINLKQAIGNSTQEIDTNVIKILKSFITLQNQMNTEGLSNLTSQTGLKTNAVGLNESYDTNVDPNMYNGLSQSINSYQNLKDNDTYTNLNSVNGVNAVDITHVDLAPIETRVNNINTINNRLQNCQNLEMLYLIKHEELMKTFSFTLKLFEKYKYAIKMILYLLKNLVKKELPLDITTRQAEADRNAALAGEIKLPKAIIKNISALLKDENNVQKVINAMKTALDSTTTPIISTNIIPTTIQTLRTDLDSEIK